MTLPTPAFFAASTSAMVPRLSTACASWPMAKGLPGTKPVATTSASAPFSVAARVSTLSFTTSRLFSATPLVSTALTCSTIAPLMVTEELAKAFSALATSRTPAVTPSPPRALRRSTMRRPVCPVAPATTTFLTSAAAVSGFPSVMDQSEQPPSSRVALRSSAAPSAACSRAACAARTPRGCGAKAVRRPQAAASAAARMRTGANRPPALLDCAMAGAALRGGA
mmetsp:Transcript_114790/g.278645  ORF Transcript_114790/g.278645 Transcript_114790/m.278645 type:complete len:224 (+) Transcript_114790:415-1086(+)